MAALIAPMKPGSIHSSASREMTQSPRARSSARAFCGPNPGQSAVDTTRAPCCRAISTVRSVLPLSMTTTSLAQFSEPRQRAMDASSFLVMTIKERLVMAATGVSPAAGFDTAVRQTPSSSSHPDDFYLAFDSMQIAPVDAAICEAYANLFTVKICPTFAPSGIPGFWRQADSRQNGPSSRRIHHGIKTILDRMFADCNIVVGASNRDKPNCRQGRPAQKSRVFRPGHPKHQHQIGSSANPLSSPFSPVQPQPPSFRSRA
jgi:hypothetical protein